MAAYEREILKLLTVDHVDSGAVAANSFVSTVAAGRRLVLHGVAVRFTSSATIGNRQIVVEIRDAADAVVARFVANLTQAASLTRYYAFAPGNAPDSAFAIDAAGVPMAPAVALATWDVVVKDDANIDAAGDTMRVQLAVQEVEVF